MKQFWVDCRPWNKECATTAIESGADAIVAERAGDVKRLGRITTVAPDGDLVYGKDVIECTIADKAGENEAAAEGEEPDRHRHHERLDGHPARKPRRPVGPDHRGGKERP